MSRIGSQRGGAPRPAGSHRQERLVEAIREELNEVVNFELDDERIHTSCEVSAVKLTSDHAKVYVLIDGTESEIEDTVAALNHAASFIRRQLLLRLNLRKAPQLHFVFDATLAAALRIEQLLKEEGVTTSEGAEPGTDEPPQTI
ncbi:MAG: 30S ribosome-binding factor RbfA [Blastocatellia bacterium]|nr:30S ribosome-binding factor RbfA [Blastocatellia bacterium]